MGYDHSMRAEVTFKPGISVTQALNALGPLVEYRGWAEEDLIMGVQLRDNDRVDITAANGDIQHLSIYTSGEVCHSYHELVDKVAEHLGSIAEAGSIELRNHDTGDLENAITTIWYGEPSAVAAAKRSHAWSQAQEALRVAGVSETALLAVKDLAREDGDIPAPTEMQPARALHLQRMQESATTQAKAVDTTAAGRFVHALAGLSIWSYDRKDGTPYTECAEPADGFLDSHTCLMQLIEEARQINSTAPVAPSAADVPWDNDAIQFPRLLREIQATQELDLAALEASMDVDREDLDALFDRANVAWETAKQGVVTSVIMKPRNAPAQGEFFPGADVEEVGSVMMQDVVGDYDLPETVPE
jgi:hypothetical protein